MRSMVLPAGGKLETAGSRPRLTQTSPFVLKTIGLTPEERYFATTVISAVADLDASAVLVATR